MLIFPVCFIDRGKARSRQRIESLIHGREAQRSNSLTQFTATIQVLDQEADRLADSLEEPIKEKNQRNFELRLLKGEKEQISFGGAAWALSRRTSEAERKGHRECTEICQTSFEVQAIGGAFELPSPLSADLRLYDPPAR